MVSATGQTQFKSIETRARDLIAQCARVTEMLSRLSTDELRPEPEGQAHSEHSGLFLRGPNESCQPKNLVNIT